jgi:thiosulfate/3-mercaptopyruvate sulfurtransferase
MYTTLVGADDLLAHLSEPHWRLFDCRFSLQDTAAGAAAYAAAHIPGACYLDLDRDLSGAVTARSGRHPLPAAETLAARLGELGVGAADQIVVYDDSAGLFASRAWWLVRALGHHAVAVLDGGLAAWRQIGGPLTAEVTKRAPRPPLEVTAPIEALSADDVARGLAAGRLTLFDVRAAERYAGRVEPLDPVAGHVPGARNLPHDRALDGGGRFHDAATLWALFAAQLGGTDPGSVAFMCGSGVTACHSLLAMEVAGLPGARLYAGSWSEWCRDPARPVATGDT